MWWWIALLACADSADTAVSGVIADCYAYCGQAAAGDGCDHAAVESACREECPRALLSVPSACEVEYRALLDCLAGVSWVCDGSVERDGVVWPVARASACVVEADVLLLCAEG